MDKVAALIADLEKSDKPTLRKAVDALISLANTSAEIASRLNRLLDEPSRSARWPIAYILANLPEPSQSALEVLIDTLGSKDPDIRWAIALLLVQLARKDETIVARLLDTVAKGTTTQRRMAVYCIRDLNLADHASLTALLNSLRDPDPMVRIAASSSLKQRSDVPPSIREILLDMFLNDSDNRVRNAVAVILAQLGAPSDEFLAALEKVTQSDDLQSRKAANAALELLKKKVRSSR